MDGWPEGQLACKSQLRLSPKVYFQNTFRKKIREGI